MTIETIALIAQLLKDKAANLSERIAFWSDYVERMKRQIDENPDDLGLCNELPNAQEKLADLRTEKSKLDDAFCEFMHYKFV